MSIRQPHVRFESQHRRLNGLAGLFLRQVRGRQLAQLLIHKRQELLGS
jgi:hypothetical protein